LPNVFTDQLAGQSWETHKVFRGDLLVGLIAKPKRQAGFFQGWKSWTIGWNNQTVDGSCKTFFGRLAKRDAIAHASQGKR
jgi:hypothetical protein